MHLRSSACSCTPKSTLQTMQPRTATSEQQMPKATLVQRIARLSHFLRVRVREAGDISYRVGAPWGMHAPTTAGHRRAVPSNIESVTSAIVKSAMVMG